jgi:DNA-binding HxlR family transcriptional regulator
MSGNDADIQYTKWTASLRKEASMHSYGQYCPMAMALEVLGERWTLMIVRDLLMGNSRFNDLARGLPGISRTLLARRLRQLEDAGVVERVRDADGRSRAYRLTQAGRELEPLAYALVHWGTRWAFGEPKPEQLDPVLLLWWLRSMFRRDRLPSERTVLQFDFRGAVSDTMWLLIDAPDVSVCLTPPGDTDLLVSADIAALYQAWHGRLTLAMALREGLVQLEGTLALIRAFTLWWDWPTPENMIATTSAPDSSTVHTVMAAGKSD